MIREIPHSHLLPMMIPIIDNISNPQNTQLNHLGGVLILVAHPPHEDMATGATDDTAEFSGV